MCAHLCAYFIFVSAPIYTHTYMHTHMHTHIHMYYSCSTYIQICLYLALLLFDLYRWYPSLTEKLSCAELGLRRKGLRRSQLAPNESALKRHAPKGVCAEEGLRRCGRAEVGLRRTASAEMS